MVRGFTKWEALAASLVMPLVTAGAWIGADAAHSYLTPVLFLCSLLFGLVTVLAWVRLLFIWP